jgi:hypothetical protein
VQFLTKIWLCRQSFSLARRGNQFGYWKFLLWPLCASRVCSGSLGGGEGGELNGGGDDGGSIGATISDDGGLGRGSAGADES